jgi:hypothetical protein
MFSIGTNAIIRWVVSCSHGAWGVVGGSALGPVVYLVLLRWCHRREDKLIECAGGVPLAVLDTLTAARWRAIRI